jgi:predicted dehydrogenase
MRPGVAGRLAAAAPVTPPFESQRNRSDMDSSFIRVGIIGYGRIGHEHAGWLAAARGIGAVAAADATPERRALAQTRSLRAVETIDALVGDSSIDAILVSSPTAFHFEHATAALSAGKHVMVEKPMAMNLQETRTLAKQAKASGHVLSVFHNRRWDADYLTVQAAVAAGTFGRLSNVESRLGQWASCVGPAAREWRPGWRNEAAFGGGGLFDWGSHFIDQLWRLMLPAKPVRVFAQLRGNVWTSDCDDFARVLIDFDNDACGLMEVNTTTTRPLPRWHIDGTAGSAESPFSLAFDVSDWAKLGFKPADGGEERNLPRAAVGLSEAQIWEQFAAACRGEGSPAVTVDSVLPTMQLLDAARASARSGRAIDIDTELTR